MERIKRKGRRSQEDELGLIKAAAWAWYQHGSASEPRSVAEFHVQKPCWIPKPTRYRLETMARRGGGRTDKEVESESESESESDPAVVPILSLTRTDMSLFDSYEIRRISTQLNCFMESSRRLSGGGGGEVEKQLPATKSWAMGRKTTERKVFGFWTRHAIRVCGSTVEEAVTPGVLRRRPRPPPGDAKP